MEIKTEMKNNTILIKISPETKILDSWNNCK